MPKGVVQSVVLGLFCFSFEACKRKSAGLSGRRNNGHHNVVNVTVF